MGYNGNNRGRTHNWSGVRNKRNYNWGLNLTAKAMAAPFAILGALIDVANEAGKQTPKPSYYYATPMPKPSVTLPLHPHTMLGSLMVYYPDITQRISILSKQKEVLLTLKRKLKSARYNIFLLRRRKRIIKALEYKILRKEQWISSFDILEKGVIGKPISCNRINGKIAVHFSDQALNKNFHEGFILKNKNVCFNEEINKTQSLTFNGKDWQMVFFSKGLVLEDKNNVVFVPYKDMVVKETWIIHYADWDTHGYDISSSSWKYTRLDGGPDLRYSCNSRIHYVQRYQVELTFKKLEKLKSLFIVFQKKEDAAALCKMVSSKYDAAKTETIKQYGVKIF